MKVLFTSILLYVLLAISSISYAQTDSLMGVAKTLVQQNKYTEAEQVYLDLLSKNTNNNDARFALGLMYSWSKQYDKARPEFATVLKARPTSKEVYISAINSELWANENANVLALTDSAKTNFPDDADILIRKAKALINLERYNEALVVVKAILAKDPNNQEALALLALLKSKNQKNSIGISYTFDYFTDNTKPWHWAYLQYSHKTSLGNIIGRLNYANRFNTNGYQLEVDAYPTLSKKSYAYVNFGFSPSTIFPDYRLGFDYYRSLPKSFEASLGFRYLYFNPTGVLIYTGHIGKYIGNYWLSFRPFIVPSNNNASISAFLIARRYFANAEDYIGLQIGYGSSPDDRSILLTGKNDLRLHAYKLRLSYNHIFSSKWILNASGGYANEEFFSTLYRTKLTLDLTLNYLF